MKKILVILLCLLPFTLFGQKQYIRNVITSDTIYFYRGVSFLNLPKDITKINKNNGSATGTLTTAALNVGGKDLSIDSISYVGTKYALWDGADTVSPHILTTDQVDISTIAVMLDDSLTGAGQYASDHRADLIEADLADYVTGIALSDSVNYSNGYMSRYDGVTGLALKVNIADTASMLTNYINKADTAGMLDTYLTEERARVLDSDTTVLFVFGTGSGYSADTALFNDGRYAGAFYNSGSDTLHFTELRGVLEDGTGTETIAVQINWDVNCFDSSPTTLNAAALAITSLTSGTVDTSFAANDIPPGYWVWCSLSGASKDNKPTMLIVNMTGYKRNRSY